MSEYEQGAEKDPDCSVGNESCYSAGTMQLANAMYLSFAIINFIVQFGKWFAYIYWGLGWTEVKNLIEALQATGLTAA